MTKPTGNPPGRPRGAKNKRTVEARARVAAAAIEAVLPGASAFDTHAFLMAVYKDPAQPIVLRLEAAGKAIRYEKPNLAAVDMTSRGEQMRFDISDHPIELDGDEWLAKHGGH